MPALIPVNERNVTTLAVRVEDILESVITKTRDLEIQNEVQRIMDECNRSSSFSTAGAQYLPGLGPQTNVTHVEEFTHDYYVKMSAPNGKPETPLIMLFYSNFAALAQDYRGMIDANEDVKRNFGPWYQALFDARILLEFQNRLARMVPITQKP